MFINNLICQNNCLKNLKKAYFCAYYTTYITIIIIFPAHFSISVISQYIRNFLVLVVCGCQDNQFKEGALGISRMLCIIELDGVGCKNQKLEQGEHPIYVNISSFGKLSKENLI